MKKIIIILIAFALSLTAFSQDVVKKWFPGTASSYVALMHTTAGDPLTILMSGGEKPVYQLGEKTTLNGWYFFYVDRFTGYTYGGPSIFTSFEKGFASFGVGAGVTSMDYKLIYAFSSYGTYGKCNWFVNTEHNAWPNWHRVWLSYTINEYVAPMVGSQACLGVGPGLKLSYKKVSLETLYHFKAGTYLGSDNEGGGLSFNLSVNL